MGPGYEDKNSFGSVVYRHDGKPRWNEVVKVTLQDQRYEDCHIRFTFTHRSRKDQYNPPYAMSFLKLNTDEGTTIEDAEHKLAVYKIENKRVDIKNNPFYLSDEMQSHKDKVQGKDRKDNGLTFIQKDVFTVTTILASTQLTQNEGLLSLLRWKEVPKHELENCIRNFEKKILVQEFVKKLSDVLDSLLLILQEEGNNMKLDQRVFIQMFKLILQIVDDNSKFKHFIPALESYIEETFCQTLAYKKLLEVLKEYLEDYDKNATDFSTVTKSLRYVFKLVVQSRLLYVNHMAGDGQEEFEEELKEVLGRIVILMHIQTTGNKTLNNAQRDCLKQMVWALPDLQKVYGNAELAEIMKKMINALPQDTYLDEAKINAIKELVQSPLFVIDECREILLPSMASHIEDFLKRGQNPAQLATVALGEILDKLNSIERTDADMNELMHKCLRTLIQNVANRQSDDENTKAIVSNLICLLHQMTEKNYESYISTFNGFDLKNR